MKLLAAILIVSILMTGLLVWQVVVGWGEGDAEQVTSTVPAAFDASLPAAPATRAARGAPPPAAQAGPTTAPATSAPDSAGVHWVNRPAHSAAERRLALARETLAQSPDHELALRDEFGALVVLERWHEALRTITRLAQLCPDDSALRFEQATVLLRLQRHVEAVGLLNELVAQEPEHARAWFNLAVAHQALGHLNEARRAWDRTLAIAPNPEAYAQRGALLLDLEEWAAALADFDAVHEYEPRATDAVLNSALALSRLGRHAEARERLLSILELQPRNLTALNRLAQTTWDEYRADPAGNATLPAAAADAGQRSLAIDPDQPDIRALLAEIQKAL